MAHVVKDRVRDTTTTTGTGTITITNTAIPGYKTFAASMSTSDTFFYCIQGGTEWEVGIGTLASSTTISRSVIRSSNSDALVSFSAGTKNVFITPIADRMPVVDTEGYILLNDDTTVPATPTAGVTLFARAISGRRLPAYVGPSGLDSSLQPFLARNKVAFFSPFPGLTTLTGFGMTPAATGTATAKTGASTNIHTQTPGVDILATTAATTAVAGYRLASAAAALSVWRGNASGFGGFTHMVRFSPATGVSTSSGTDRLFVGLSNSSSAPTDVEPSTLTNMVGVGYDSADTNWQIYGNDNSGTAGKYSTGFAVPTTDRPGLYEVAIFCKPNDSSITVTFTDVGAGNSFQQIITTSADLVPATTFMAGRGYHSAGGTSTVTGLTIFGIYHESDL